MKTFEVGKTYATRSICDSDCWFTFTILSRTAKTVTIEVRGKQVRRGLSVYDGAERFLPFGRYSMCAIISADDEGRGPMIATRPGDHAAIVAAETGMNYSDALVFCNMD